ARPPRRLGVRRPGRPAQRRGRLLHVARRRLGRLLGRPPGVPLADADDALLLRAHLPDGPVLAVVPEQDERGGHAGALPRERLLRVRVDRRLVRLGALRQQVPSPSGLESRRPLLGSPTGSALDALAPAAPTFGGRKPDRAL